MNDFYSLSPARSPWPESWWESEGRDGIWNPKVVSQLGPRDPDPEMGRGLELRSQRRDQRLAPEAGERSRSPGEAREKQSSESGAEAKGWRIGGSGTKERSGAEGPGRARSALTRKDTGRQARAGEANGLRRKGQTSCQGPGAPAVPYRARCAAQLCGPSSSSSSIDF